ncbi:PREDICTED: leishmanolysin-like peptidase [Amphimedon queenslandica]|uniref:Leishmanolysin-like peptidase n=1 Tax=Amphimedon queenslandica TaxID=400682 RepID=A0A1X7VQC5_AMPQE|nr:PREDICTED: leishmanolysin-like peptidase [Amphimedon queenslandica]|eukprot:XP_019855035.1 PREDICTED: leishmanolysin-like peptidase [Amphimedon queenslandica]
MNIITVTNVMILLQPLFLVLYSSSALLELAVGEWAPLQIQPIYHHTVDSLNPELSNFVKCHLFGPAIDWINGALSVEKLKHSSNDLLLESHCPFGYYVHPDEDNVDKRFCRNKCDPVSYCGPIPVDEKYTQGCTVCIDNATFINCYDKIRTSSWKPRDRTNYVLHVAALNSSACNLMGVVSTGGTCKQHATNDRPLIGYINICIERIVKKEQTIYYILQEIMRILGFSYRLIPYFRTDLGFPLMLRDLNGLPLRDKDGMYLLDPLIINVHMYNNWTDLFPNHFTKILKLKAVVREAKKQFNCSLIKGLPLEDKSNGRLLWESRLMMGDIMTNYWDNSVPVISRITLALFEDTGWYKPNYNYAGTLHWGKDKGCGFLDKSCKELSKEDSAESFCNNSVLQGCNSRFNGMTICTGGVYYKYVLPEQYQYFYDEHAGGHSPLIDYCPYYSNDNPSTSPFFDDEVVSSNCDGKRCIVHNNSWNVTVRYHNTIIPFGASCYKVSCSKNNLKILIDDKWYACKENDTLISINITKGVVTYVGELKCPPYERFCHARDCVNDCSNKGVCVNGHCYCHPGYYGVDCNLEYSKRYFGHCQHICNVGVLTYRRHECGCWCDCAAALLWGYSGYTCIEKVPPNKCTPGRCRQGVCARTNGGKSFKCLCNEGYGGNRCTTKL